jgi:hypothetical protein
MFPVPLSVSWALTDPALTIVMLKVPEPEAPLYAPLPPLMVPVNVAVVLKFGMVAVTLKPSNLLNAKVIVA